MDWVKLRTNYYGDPALIRAGEAAEVLFTRGLAYAGDHETGGVIDRGALPYLAPVKGAQRANALVRAGLWEAIPEGWRICSWDKHQMSVEQLAASRDAARLRQARRRGRSTTPNGHGVSHGVTDGVSHAAVTGTEVEEEVDAAAAAPREPLPPPLEILRSKLEGRQLKARWDRLTPAQHTQIEALIAVHGDAPLVECAARSHRPDSPAMFAQAWLASWEALPPPGGRRLAAVTEPRCDQPGHQGTLRHCAQCASEAKAGHR